MGELQHECGIAGVYLLPESSAATASSEAWFGSVPPTAATAATPACNSPGPLALDRYHSLELTTEREVAQLIPRMLLDLQHRGQLAAGMSSYNPERPKLIDTHKQLGFVTEAFRMNRKPKFDKLMVSMAGLAAIGHVRYATCGKDDRSYAQPFERVNGCRWKWFTFVFNGQLANYHQLAAVLKNHEDYHLTRQSDTEVIMHYISYELRGGRLPPAEIFRRLANQFDGAYNLIYLNAMGEMFVLRDPLGLRPLCAARAGRLVAFASESVALQNLGFREIRSLAPGEMLTLNSDGVQQDFLPPPTGRKSAHCFFEWIYFANVASELDERAVYQVRAHLGRELAQREPLTPDADTIVVPVPDTAKAAADAMAFELKVPSVEGLIRNRYVGRTFIQGRDRGQSVRMKYTPLRHVLAGKKVLLVEDTIVRSTTMRALLGIIREIGEAKEIHVRVACPPIVAPCFYGIDMSTIEELFAPKFYAEPWLLTDEIQQRMADELGADSLRYLPIEALARALEFEPNRLCLGCVTGQYPTAHGKQLYQLAAQQFRQEATNGTSGRRTYENPLGERLTFEVR